MVKKALITGITGQDGSYLAELLISKGYEVHGLKRRSSSFNTDRIDNLYNKYHESGLFNLHYGDLLDAAILFNLINNIKPHEIYNLGAQSHVSVSFDTPLYTSDVNALGTLRILECIRSLKLENHTKFYQASSSELFGKVVETPQNETTPFYPRSPYAVAKLFSYWITINYREAYNIFACNGILFNHESPRRGETFVTRKITRQLSRIAFGLEKTLKLGNLDAKRDWGHAKDYVEMQWLMLQQNKPRDYVISTGLQYSVRDFINISCKFLKIEIEWVDSGLDEKGIIKSVNGEQNHKFKVGDVLIIIDEKYFTPTEVESLLGDASKAKDLLGWKPKISFETLVSEMLSSDLEEAKKIAGFNNRVSKHE